MRCLLSGFFVGRLAFSIPSIIYAFASLNILPLVVRILTRLEALNLIYCRHIPLMLFARRLLLHENQRCIASMFV